jgi:hypothetical protein
VPGGNTLSTKPTIHAASRNVNPCTARSRTTAAVTKLGWASGPLAPADGTDVAYLFCEPARPGARSPLARALVDVLSRGPLPATLEELQDALRRRWDGPEGDETPCSLHSVLLCDPERFPSFPGHRPAGREASPEHVWRRAASRHVGWSRVPDSASAGRLRDAAVELVAQLGRERDRSLARLKDDPWSDPDLALRTTKRVAFLLTRLPPEGEPLSAAEAALLVAVPFLYEAFWTTSAAEASDVRPTHLDFRADGGERADFGAFAKLNPRLLRRAERARRTGDDPAVAGIGWWLLHRWVAARPDSHQAGALTNLLAGTAADPLTRDVFREDRVAELLQALRKANLTGAVLDEATLTDADLAGVRWSAGTVWPDSTWEARVVGGQPRRQPGVEPLLGWVPRRR